MSIKLTPCGPHRFSILTKFSLACLFLLFSLISDTQYSYNCFKKCKKIFGSVIHVYVIDFFLFLFAHSTSLAKLHIFQIKMSLTHDQQKHHGREHSLMSIILVNIIKKPLFHQHKKSNPMWPKNKFLKKEINCDIVLRKQFLSSG